ncbi:uncharacterized protein LOC143186671 [Calliopsis andreniformis]|uniref:uncharacterized protein LOC143186671 n=1 Tax=Calliopsis andreniformis TaxID=337506 RepID=UPI003FCC36CF
MRFTCRRSPIEYQLSDQRFIQRGWTVLPVAKTLREIVLYEAKPAKPHLNWFKKHKIDGKRYYSNGTTVFMKFHVDGTGDVFYPNGKLAISLQKPKNREYDMYTVFTPGGKDCVGVERESQIVAVFDTMGNGAVFDEDGATRLFYNQVGGIWRDNPAGLPLTWKWNEDEKESIVATVYVEKSTAHLEKFLRAPAKEPLKSSGTAKVPTSPASSRNKDKKVAEQEPVVAVHSDVEEVGSVQLSSMAVDLKVGSLFCVAIYGKFNFNYFLSINDARKLKQSGSCKEGAKETCHMPVICMKLTDYISLRILDRRNINLQFFAPGVKSIRIELGTVLNRKKKVASYIVDANSIDAILKCRFDNSTLSDLKADSSLYKLSQELWKIKRSARQRNFMINKYRPYFSSLFHRNIMKKCISSRKDFDFVNFLRNPSKIIYSEYKHKNVKGKDKYK